ncbi:hypothetical protein F383_36960 [Gossypium arboreum]|uniref:Uncharacterized protein n=1 Tax=Gossypium arboreum TaxID=29729 RepID=A0A0B0MBC5_GOSAR|nr:hypothetical protein F383_36960 [Gossypium arboreum]
MFRSRTKEIGFRSGENKSRQLAALFHFITSELGSYVQVFVSTELRHPKAPYEP